MQLWTRESRIDQKNRVVFDPSSRQGSAHHWTCSKRSKPPFHGGVDSHLTSPTDVVRYGPARYIPYKCTRMLILTGGVIALGLSEWVPFMLPTTMLTLM